MLIPDLKWDLKTVSTLVCHSVPSLLVAWRSRFGRQYLSAIAHDASITSLRALRRRHLPLLRGIEREATRICQERYGVQAGGLRMYVHYQPSYCKWSCGIAGVLG